MFEFIKNCELFAVEPKTSKNGNQYYLFTLLAENGRTIDVVYTGNTLNLGKLQSRETYDFNFKLELGRYIKLTITDILF